MHRVESVGTSLEGLECVLHAPSLDPHYLRADSLRDPVLEPSAFVFQDAGEIFYHPFHIADVPGTQWRDVQSAHGYGGPAASTMDEEFLDRAWEAYCAWCRERRVLVEFIRFHPLLENWRYYRGEVFENRSTVWVDLGVADLLASYQRRCRQQVRRAYAEGLRVTWEGGDAFLDVFLPLYETMLESKGADEFYRFPPSYHRAMVALKSALGGVCWRGNQAVAAGLFLQGAEILEYHLGASSPLGRECGATTLLLHEAALVGQQAGCRRLHLGGGTDTRPDNALLFFKSGLSTRRASFRVGRFLHDAAGYHSLQSGWRARFGGDTKRVLFYRG
jgi:hypothetical protein